MLLYLPHNNPGLGLWSSCCMTAVLVQSLVFVFPARWQCFASAFGARQGHVPWWHSWCHLTCQATVASSCVCTVGSTGNEGNTQWSGTRVRTGIRDKRGKGRKEAYCVKKQGKWWKLLSSFIWTSLRSSSSLKTYFLFAGCFFSL